MSTADNALTGLISVTPFREALPDQSHPYRAEAVAEFAQPGGALVQVRLSLFMLEDGRVGIGAYPSPDRGAVLRWDNGPDGDPRVIFWQAPQQREGAKVMLRDGSGR